MKKRRFAAPVSCSTRRSVRCEYAMPSVIPINDVHAAGSL
jgi:hypothetical protein